MEVIEFILIISGFTFWIGIIFCLILIILAKKDYIAQDEENISFRT